MKLLEEQIPSARPTDVWSKDVPVEESSYYYRGTPLVLRSNKPAYGLTVAELFSGCGGLSTGFSMAGFTSILGADIHAPSVDTYQRNHAHASTLLGDLCKVPTNVLEAVLPSRP
ncbi:MAG: DNA cytosine methyltransferase, partial [Fimbriimonadaceae bacterium]